MSSRSEGRVLASLLTGVTLGLSVAMPFGPVGLLCVQRSLAAGAALGIATGLGAALVHVFYATLAMAGANAASVALVAWGKPVRYLSCALLIGLGARILRRPPPSAQPARLIRAPMAFASSFALAICNPLTILPYLLFASSAAAMGGADTTVTAWSPVGVFVGTTAWYCAISGGAALFRSSLPSGAIRGLNYVAGCMLIGFGLLVLCR